MIALVYATVNNVSQEKEARGDGDARGGGC
jgi:hypothetical protein